MSATPEPDSVPMLGVTQALTTPDATVVDLRSPAEYAQDHMPGAVNVPLFGDLQRAMVGFLYNQVSPDAALAKGEEYAMQRVRELAHSVGAQTDWQPPAGDFGDSVRKLCSTGIGGLETMLQPYSIQCAPERPVILHCWRGGLRSRSVVSLFRGLGLNRAVGLTGGYKAYRTGVLGTLSAWSGPQPIVLHGLTGVGKTLVLREIERLRPGWTLDLEALAGHRSSLLGMVGLEPCSQKTFDSRLFGALSEHSGPTMVIEGESRKVGDVILAPGLWGAMGSGRTIWLKAPMQSRVQVLMDDYLGLVSNREHLRRQIQALSPRLPTHTDWLDLFDSGREKELVQGLLEEHYDPLYTHSRSESECEASFDTQSPEQAAQAIVDWIAAELA